MKRKPKSTAITPMDRTMSRRSAIRAFTTAGIALAALFAFGRTSVQGAFSPYTVSVNSNFRTGPGTDHGVITVIPKGSRLTLTTPERNNFYGVTYNGNTGWVYAPLVVTAGSSGDPAMVGEAYTTAAVNLRSGPGPEHTVLRVVARDASLNVSNTVQDGFRYVVHQGLAGWIANQFIAWRSVTGPGKSFATTTDLNLRAEPDIAAKVLVVMPAGATVRSLDDEANGFRKVSFLGTTGWAATAYLT